MNNLMKGLIFTLGFVPCVGFAQKTVQIDVKSNVHSISPYIYGANATFDKATATRWGGNRSTSYNWESNASNGGNDYEFISDNHYDYSGSHTPATPILSSVKSADSKGQYSLVSLQACGYVAADMDGAVTAEEIAPSDRWKAVSFKKNSPYTLTPDLTDDTVYIDELINYLSANLGRAGDGGVSAYAIDNEPYLWNSTHARMHPNKTTPEELLEKTIKLSSVIRELAPGADVVGPMFFGYTDAYKWGMENDFAKWNTYAHFGSGNTAKDYYNWFVEYYLNNLRLSEEATGIRPIDAIAFHWYPESYGKTTHARIVNVTGDEETSTSEMVAPDMIEARLQAPRSLWDKKYTYTDAAGNTSYVCTWQGQAIIKKIQKSIDTFYPGTKIAFTEFEFGAEDHWSGGLSLVDVLGVFGKENVYLACKWNSFKKYGSLAYDLYLDYDGNGSKFGNTSVYAMGDTTSLSTFASLDDNKNLHIIVVNKTADAQNTTFNIDNGLYTNGVVYGFGQSSSTITQIGTIGTITNSSFAYSLPAYSAVHIILNAAPQTEILNAHITDPNANKIVMSFTDPLSLASAIGAANEFTVSVNKEIMTVSSVEVAEKTATLTLTNPVSANNDTIVVSYNGTNVMGSSNLPIYPFDTVRVYNELAGTPMEVLDATIDTIGSFVKISFSREIGSIQNIGGITITQNNTNVTIDSVKKSTESPYDLYVYPAIRIVKYLPTTLANSTQNDLTATDGTTISNFSLEIVGGANYAPTVDSIVMIDNFNVNMHFNAAMSPNIDYTNVGLTVTHNGTTLEYSANYKTSARILQLTMKEPMLPGEEYIISYTDHGKVVTIHNGVLGSFSQTIANNLRNTEASVVTVPGVMQGEQYWYCVGDPVVEVCGDTAPQGNGNSLGYISTGDSYFYKISVPKETKYTFTVRYASERVGELNYTIDNNTYHLTLPQTSGFTVWKDAFRVIPLTEGEHEIKVDILEGGFNVNYIEVTEEEKYPNATITRAQVLSSGNSLFIYFSTGIETLPTPEELTFTSNDTVINIASVNYNTNSTNTLKCTFDTLIYAKKELKLSFASKTILTFDGGGVLDTTLTVLNKSTKYYVPPVIDAISTIDGSNFVISPVPVEANADFVITTNDANEISYTIINSLGATVATGNFTTEATLSIPNPGVYSIVFVSNSNTFTKKIIVK